MEDSKEMGIPDRITCLLINLYAGQGETVRTGRETTDWVKIGKEVHQGCMLSPCLFNFCRVHQAKCWATQGGIKIAERNISNLTYAYDITYRQKLKRN